MAAMSGIVQSWNDEGRWGKIKKHAADGKWYFIHYMNIVDGDRLATGEHVTFQTEFVHRTGQKRQEVAVQVHGGFWSKSFEYLKTLGFSLPVDAPLIQELLAADFLDADVKLYSYQVGAYSRMSDGCCTQFAPPVYTPCEPPYHLEKDKWDDSSTQCHTDIRETLLEIIPESVMADAAIVTDRNNLIKLLHFLDSEKQLYKDRFVFKINVARHGHLVVLRRADLLDPETHMPISHVLGHGFGFEQKVTKTVVPDATKHCVIQQVAIGDVSVLVRAEVDALDPSDGLVEIKSGNIKYRNEWGGWKPAAIQMLLGGSKKLVVGWHDKGHFQGKLEVLTFAEAEKKAEGYDRKFGALASLLSKIIELSRTFHHLDLVYSPPQKGTLSNDAKLCVYGEQLQQQATEILHASWHLLPSGPANYVRILN